MPTYECCDEESFDPESAISYEKDSMLEAAKEYIRDMVPISRHGAVVAVFAREMDSGVSPTRLEFTASGGELFPINASLIQQRSPRSMKAQITVSVVLPEDAIKAALADWALRNVSEFKDAEPLTVEIVTTKHTTGYGYGECDVTKVEARITAKKP